MHPVLVEGILFLKAWSWKSVADWNGLAMVEFRSRKPIMIG